ncbi:hypothetical protein GE21DRAFT_2319 [Neurospora crassa]|uniref:Uncharacterized protein n=1 Tax=Neurospora crassa (strain ATCC 24698 / 74-OR23-1A / CBS 708.71 / DSM 1257 / FGSC 987) TaxID=367110 RepID=Q7RUY5_NEUCR|nr:hypothetical protein NCU02976 [Neurospora crassa OR74A]EAA36127.3 hypothetical protein NCU02976 [Neurospora crassa OR74A]KHE89245.1 hypothetical protein GE21DRAFT_2319 [Neurospora crassa]|eukprot:XP_965363.3 hypothetical protein NCU02976 [Neurospora crassa OR74A]
MDRRPTQSGHSHDVSHSRSRFAGRSVEEIVDILTKLDRANSQPDDRALVRGTEPEGASSPGRYRYRYSGPSTGNLQETPDIGMGFNTKDDPPRLTHRNEGTGKSIPRYPAHRSRPGSPSRSWPKHASRQLQQQNNQQPTTIQPSNDQLKNKVVDAIHDPSLSTKDITVRIGLPIEQDISLDLESFCRLRRLGRFSEARKVYESKLVQHSTAPYILVQYAEMLVVSGNYRGFHELIYPEESASAADHNLAINFALLELAAHSETLGYTAHAMKTVLSVINSMKGTQLVGSTEIQMFSLCLQIMCYLKPAVHEDVVSEALINAKTVFEWKSLYSRLLGEARIWDFRDLLVGAASLFGWDETSIMFFGSTPLDQVLNMIHQDWLQTGDDEATVLGLLDIFTSLILHGRPLDPTRQPLLSSFAGHARVLAEVAQQNNPDNMNTRPFIQFILAKTVIEMVPVPKRPDGVTLRNFMGLLLDQGDEIQLPVFVPLWHSSKPGWGMVSARANPAQRTAVEVALGAAMQGDDFHLQALALKILCLQSQDPSNLLDALLTLQLKTQGDHDGFLRTWLAKYLIADHSTDHEALLETLAQSTRFVDSSKRYYMANPSLVWAKEVIKDHLLARVSGQELHAPNWGNWFNKHGRNLPQYIVDFIYFHYHLELPLPTRVSFEVSEGKKRNSWEGKQPEPDVDGDDDWGYDSEGSHDGTGSMDEEPHDNTPVRRSVYADRVRAAPRARINEPFHDHRRYDHIQRLRSPDKNRSPATRPPPGPVIPPDLVIRASPSNRRGRRSLSPSTVRIRTPSPDNVLVRRPSFSSSDHSWGRFMVGGERQRESLESKIFLWEDGYREEHPRQDICVRMTQCNDDDDDGSMVVHDDNANHTRTARDDHIKVGVDRLQHKVRFVESGRPQLGSQRVKDERPDNAVRSSGDRCGDIGYSTQVPKSVNVDNHKSELLFSSKILKDNTVTVSVRNRKDPDKVARYEIESTGIQDITLEDKMPIPTTVSGRLNQRDAKAEVREQQAVPSQQESTPPRSTSSESSSIDLDSTLSMSAWMESRTLNQNHGSRPSQPISTSHDSNTLNDIEVERPEYVTTKKQDLARSTAKSQILPGGRSSTVSRASKRAESPKGEETQNEWPTVDAEERPGYTNETSSSLSEKALNELNADSTERQQRPRDSNTIAAIASNEEARGVNDDTNNGLSVESLQESESGGGVDEDLANVSGMHQVPKPLSRRPTVQDDSDDDFMIRCAKHGVQR